MTVAHSTLTKGAIYQREWRKRKKEKLGESEYLKQQREYDQKHRLQREYGIDKYEFDMIFTQQGNCCALCETVIPKGRHNNFVVDHNHITGNFRGILCNNCNVGLGTFKDNKEILKKAINYLERGDEIDCCS